MIIERGDVLFDVKKNILVAYDGSEEFHRRFGGGVTYRSLSGKTVIGKVKGGICLRKVGSYKAHVPIRHMFAGSLVPSNREYVGGKVVLVPLRKNGEVDSSSPAIIISEGDDDMPCFCFIPCNHLYGVLFGENQELFLKLLKIKYVVSSEGQPSEEKFEIKIEYMPADDGSAWDFHRLMEGMIVQSVGFKTEECYLETPRFFQRLGLWKKGGFFFKVSEGLARKYWPVDEINKKEVLEKASPENVFVISPSCYIQEGRNGYEIVSLEGVETMEKKIEPFEAISLING